MEIVSVEFLFFFLCTFLIYHAIPARTRCVFLLAASYFFYGSRDIRYLVFLVAATLISYCGALVTLMVDLLNERGIFISRHIAKERLWIRWPIYIAAILLICVCGIWGPDYDSSSFIYYQF